MPQRLQRQRTRGWRRPEGAVIVDRTSRFGNPFRVGQGYQWSAQPFASGHDFSICADRAVALFRFWLGFPKAIFWEMGDGEPRRMDLQQRRITLLDALPQLVGRDLLCFCAPGAPCHGDELLRRAALLPEGLTA